MIRITLATFTAVLLAAVLMPALAQDAIKVGVFDPQRISEETLEGKRVQEQLSTLRESNLKQLTAKQQAIETLQGQLSTQALSLSVDKRTKLELDIQRRMLELNQAKDLASQVLQMELGAAQGRFNDRLLAVVESFGRQEGFDLILDRTLVAWASDSVDLTTAIGDAYDKMFPGAASDGGE